MAGSFGLAMYNCNFMMKVICMMCGRWREKEGEAEAPSHGLCAKCACATKDGRGVPVGNLSREEREEMRQDIKKEIQAGIIWQGEEKENTDSEGLKLYEELLAEVQTELSTERQKELGNNIK